MPSVQPLHFYNLRIFKQCRNYIWSQSTKEHEFPSHTYADKFCGRKRQLVAYLAVSMQKYVITTEVVLQEKKRYNGANTVTHLCAVWPPAEIAVVVGVSRLNVFYLHTFHVMRAKLQHYLEKRTESRKTRAYKVIRDNILDKGLRLAFRFGLQCQRYSED